MVFITCLKKIRLFPFRGRKPYFLLYKTLGFHPGNSNLYWQALRHKSIVGENKSNQLESNERLEFLGDAILNAVITDILFEKYQTEREGFLTDLRSNIVKREQLNLLAIKIGLPQIIVFNKHVMQQKASANIYGNALEALIGAIYIDKGYIKTRSYILSELVNKHIDIESLALNNLNYKSKLIEWGQKNQLTIRFELVEQTLHNNNYSFCSEVYINNQKIALGNGKTKRESQQDAAKQAWIIREYVVNKA